MLMKHRIMIQYSITVCHIDLYRRSLVCTHAMYAHAHGCICVRVDTFVYIYTQVTRVCQGIPHHMSGTFTYVTNIQVWQFLINI